MVHTRYVCWLLLIIVDYSNSPRVNILLPCLATFKFHPLFRDFLIAILSPVSPTFLPFSETNHQLNTSRPSKPPPAKSLGWTQKVLSFPGSAGTGPSMARNFRAFWNLYKGLSGQIYHSITVQQPEIGRMRNLMRFLLPFQLQNLKFAYGDSGAPFRSARDP